MPVTTKNVNGEYRNVVAAFDVETKKAGLSSRTTITLSIYKFLFSNVILVASSDSEQR